jgi:hypothetical protein
LGNKLVTTLRVPPYTGWPAAGVAAVLVVDCGVEAVDVTVEAGVVDAVPELQPKRTRAQITKPRNRTDSFFISFPPLLYNFVITR